MQKIAERGVNMPLPFIIGGIAAVAGVTGIGSGIHGGLKMKDAKDTMDLAERMQKRAVEKFSKKNESTTKLMDEIGQQELNILNSFRRFLDTMEKIQGRPQIDLNIKNGVKLPEYVAEELEEVSAGAGVLLGGVGGAVAGTFGGYAAAGATTTAVMALGTASTGTAISTLSGAAATNATLAALGGGSLASGGGGIALGTSILGGATLGVGLLVGGVIFNITGEKLSEKADEAYFQARKTEQEVDHIVEYLDQLIQSASLFKKTLVQVEKIYIDKLNRLDNIVDLLGKTEWSEFVESEKQITQDTILLVGLLYKMCKTKLVQKNPEKEDENIVNQEEIEQSIADAKQIIDDIA